VGAEPPRDTASVKVIDNCAIQLAIHDFLLVFHCSYCSYVSILHHFQDIIDYFPKFEEVKWLWPHPLEGLFVNLKTNTSHGQKVYKIWIL